MSRLVLATRNPGKVLEAQPILCSIQGLILLTHEHTPFPEVEETGETFLENALLKAEAACRHTKLPALAEDTGLEVLALGGAPGVRSARFSGLPPDPARNNALLLQQLAHEQDRRARFITTAVLCLPDGQVFASSGVLHGEIAAAPRGEGGFGYDPLFIPQKGTRTLAELPLSEKNQLSHRHKALVRMQGILRDLIERAEL